MDYDFSGYATRNDIQGGDFMTFPSYPKKWNEARIGWMKRDFEVPAAWKGKRVILRFDGVLGKCEVYVNGQKAMENFDSFMPSVDYLCPAFGRGEEGERQKIVNKS